MNYKELKEKFRNKSVDGEWFLLTAPDAIEMIKFGFDTNMNLGIVEGFTKTQEGAFEPRQEYSSNQFMNLEEEEYKAKTIELINSSVDIPNLFFEVFMD